MSTPACLTCGTSITSIAATVDPKAVDVVLRAQCGHDLDNEVGRDLWRRLGYRWSVPVVDGASLMTAERERQRTEEGYTPEHDRQHNDGLPWAAWCYLDRAVNPTADTAPPPAWPWADDDWKPDADEMRRLVIAGALIAAEIDRRLMEQRSHP